MKKIGFILLFSTISFFGFAQKVSINSYQFIINYKKSYKINKAQKDYKYDYYAVLTNNESSVYRPIGELIFDTIQHTEKYKKMSQDQQISLYLKYGTDINEMITTTIKNKAIVHTFGVSGASDLCPRYTEIINHKWKLENEISNINGNKCKKATCTLFGRNWTAWYSIKHPIPFGPYKFFGLPGLIIKIEDDTQSYKFEVTSIIQRNKLYPKEVFEDVFNTTKQKTMQIFENGRFSMASFDGAQMEASVRKKLEEGARKRKENENNPIELKPFIYN